MIENIISGAPIKKPTEVTILERVSMKPVNAGSVAPILLNISSKVGTININKARLIVTAKTRTATGYMRAPVICPFILLCDSNNNANLSRTLDKIPPVSPASIKPTVIGANILG